MGASSWPMAGQSAPADSYVNELFGHSFSCYPLSMLGGILWNLANILVCKGITMMGQALGFPMCVGLGLGSGAITAYVISPVGDLWYLIPGICLALVAICLTGYISYIKEHEVEQARMVGNAGSVELALRSGESPNECRAVAPSMTRKFVVCTIGGLLLGLSNIGVTGATTNQIFLCSLSPYANQSFFSLGAFLSSLIVIPGMIYIPIEGGKGECVRTAMKGYCSVRAMDHVLSAFGAFVVCMGFFFFNLGAPKLGSATAYSIGQSAPLVAILWGTFFFKEFKDASSFVKCLIPVVCFIFIGAVILIGGASP